MVCGKPFTFNSFYCIQYGKELLPIFHDRIVLSILSIVFQLPQASPSPQRSLSILSIVFSSYSALLLYQLHSVFQFFLLYSGDLRFTDSDGVTLLNYLSILSIVFVFTRHSFFGGCAWSFQFFLLYS